MKKFNINMRYISMNKIAFTFIATTILLLTSFIPVAEKVVAEKSNETKKIVVPVQIYTLQGVKEIKKELPLKEATKLKEKAYEAAKAIETLHDKNASFMEKIKANEIIDSFLYEMKKNGLLGEMSIEEAKELITGKYLEKQKNSIEARKLMLLSKLLSQSGWQVNALCYFSAFGAIADIFPWNLIPILLGWIILNKSPYYLATLLLIFIVFPFMLLDCVPHTTTVGYWIVRPAGMPYKHAHLQTKGLFGEKATGEFKEGEAIALTIGFTGVVIFLVAEGFTLFTAFKKI